MATEKPFSITQNQKSGIQTGVLSAASIVSLIALARAFGVEPWPPEQDIEMATKIAGGIYVIGHVYGSVVNWFKNRKRPIVTTMGLPLILLCAALALQGCATGSGLGGTTKYEMSFSDRQQLYDPETGEATNQIGATGFNVKASGKAGDVIQQVAKMGYKWDGDGSGNITVASDAQIDSTARAQALVEFYQIQATNFAQFSALLQMGMGLAAPLVGQHMDLGAAQAQANLLSRDANLAQIYPMIGQGLQQGQADSQANIEKLLPSLIQRMDKQDSLIEQIMTVITQPPTPAPVVVPPTP